MTMDASNRDDLLVARLMAARADIGDRLVPLLDQCLGSGLTAGDTQEVYVRSVECAIHTALVALTDLKGFGVTKP